MILSRILCCFIKKLAAIGLTTVSTKMEDAMVTSTKGVRNCHIDTPDDFMVVYSLFFDMRRNVYIAAANIASTKVSCITNGI